MANRKPLSVMISMETKLSVERHPTTLTKMKDAAYIPYASAVGILMYVMVSTRPDIVQAVGFLSKFMAIPRHEHWIAVKRIFKYLRGTFEYSICYHSDVSRDPRSLDI
jgi:ATP-binding cassette subfamily B (MDR/TAP) protein 1